MTTILCKENDASKEISMEVFDSCTDCSKLLIQECIPYCCFSEDEDEDEDEDVEMTPISELDECPIEDE